MNTRPSTGPDMQRGPLKGIGDERRRLRSVVVSISDMKVSANTGEVLVSYSLGSCLGVSVYDPVAKIGGLLHCMLPLSKVDRQKATERPCMFVDTGMTLFLNRLFKMGAKRKRCIVKLTGCSQILDRQGLFRIGQRNHAVCRKILWKNGMLIEAEDVGGEETRTIWLEIATGRVLIKSKQGIKEL